MFAWTLQDKTHPRARVFKPDILFLMHNPNMRPLFVEISKTGVFCSFLLLAALFSAPQASAHYVLPHSGFLASSDAVREAVLQTQSASDKPKPATPAAANGPDQSGAKPPEQQTSPSKQQPKRILGIMPNFRAVSADKIPPPPTPKQALWLATQNSFDYSSFLFVGFTSLFAEADNAHPQLGRGVGGFGRYYWRGFVDKTNGNYLVIFALPTVFHEDERYFAKGKGGFWKRLGYSSTRVLITPNYQGHNTFNASELLGRAMAQGISTTYYPSGARTAGALASKFGYAILRDALTNSFREFWPDIAVHVLHRHP